MGWIDCHVAPDRSAIAQNVANEPEGERIRAELEDFLNRNNIVSVLLDTDQHNVQIDIVKLPPEIKPVLTCWGSVFVRNGKGRNERSKGRSLEVRRPQRIYLTDHD